MEKLLKDLNNFPPLADINERKAFKISKDIALPKIYVRKVVGHQCKNIIFLQKKYNVQITYDDHYMNDEFYNLDEISYIKVEGCEWAVKAVSTLVTQWILLLQVVTIVLPINDCKNMKSDIYYIKNRMDPADLRISKATNHKINKELNHPFFFMPNYTQNLMLIGFNAEISSALVSLEEILTKRHSPDDTFTCSYLVPLYTADALRSTLPEMAKLANNGVQLFVYDPNPPRKQATLLVIGKWSDILGMRNLINNKVSDLMDDSNYPQYREYYEYQQIRCSLQNLRQYMCGYETSIKQWDITSENLSALTSVGKSEIVKDSFALMDSILVTENPTIHNLNSSRLLSVLKDVVFEVIRDVKGSEKDRHRERSRHSSSSERYHHHSLHRHRR